MISISHDNDINFIIRWINKLLTALQHQEYIYMRNWMYPFQFKRLNSVDGDEYFWMWSQWQWNT